jgi:hypothetical protein
MAKTVAHLGESARDELELSVAERIDHLRRPRWIGYSQAKKVLNQLEDTTWRVIGAEGTRKNA